MGNVGRFGDAWIWGYQPTDGPAGPTTVTITATDDGGLTATTTFTLTVNNVAPTAASPASRPRPRLRGDAMTLGSAVTDPSPVDTAAGFVLPGAAPKNGSICRSVGPTATLQLHARRQRQLRGHPDGRRQATAAVTPGGQTTMT